MKAEFVLDLLLYKFLTHHFICASLRKVETFSSKHVEENQTIKLLSEILKKNQRGRHDCKQSVSYRIQKL